jgi:hypothetical protein
MRFVALALTSVLLLFTRSGLNQDDYKLKDGTVCALEGTAQSDKGRALNRHKNRYQAPTASDIDSSVTLASMLLPADNGDEERFDQEKAAKVQGYVISVKTSKTPESCNCDATDSVDQDTHIELGLSKNAHPNQRVIVEITPRLRKQMADMSPPEDWSSEALDQRLAGKWVEFTGWMTFDYIHADKSENTNPRGQGNWRATAWEIHPVTSINSVSDQAPPDTPELHPAQLAAFHAAAARVVERDPKRQEAVRKRLDKYLEGLSEKELKEKQEEDKSRP